MKVVCRLKELMEVEGINQNQLAQKTGIAPSTIGRLYRNASTRYDDQTLVALAKYFRLEKMDDLIKFELD
ncbi:helix-turn-helix domain-containing protein [Nostoc sp. UIC 10890]